MVATVNEPVVEELAQQPLRDVLCQRIRVTPASQHGRLRKQHGAMEPKWALVVHLRNVQGDELAGEGARVVGIPGTGTWFDVARAVGEDLVPARTDWVVLHVRDHVVQLVRDGRRCSLAEAGIGDPQVGERLSLALLRHRDGDHEVALHAVVEALAPRVGDAYGAGRVAQTGLSRLACAVDQAHLRAVAPDDKSLRMLEQLDLGSAVIAPVVAAGVVIGVLTLVHSPGSLVPRDDLAVAEGLGCSIGATLDASRPTTAETEPKARRGRRPVTWAPPREGNPVAATRAWVRRTLPEVVDRPVRPDLGDDLDVVVSELAGNAIRHTGTLGDVTLALGDNVVHVAVCDPEDRPPTLRRPDPDGDSGRGLLLVAALSQRWNVDHDLEHGGKAVWAELPI